MCLHNRLDVVAVNIGTKWQGQLASFRGPSWDPHMSFPGVWQIQKKPQYPTRCGVGARMRASILCFWHPPRDMRVYNGPTDTTSFVLISLIFLRVWNFDTCRLKVWQAPHVNLGLEVLTTPRWTTLPTCCYPFLLKESSSVSARKVLWCLCLYPHFPPAPRAIFPLLILLLSVCFVF